MDYIKIKAINLELQWNQSIAHLMNDVSYSINYENKEISLYISRGQWDNNIEFIRCNIGTYNLDYINEVYFNKLNFDFITNEEKVNNFIQSLDSEVINFNFGSRNKLELNYIGDNELINSHYQLISNSIEPDFENQSNWNFEINQVRGHLKQEYHQNHYDWNYAKRTRYQWLSFKELNLFGLISDKFRGYYVPEKNELIVIEAVIGTDVSKYKHVYNLLVSKIGNPFETAEPKYDEHLQHTFLKDKWNINGFSVETKSTMIPQVDKMRYEIEIRKRL